MTKATHHWTRCLNIKCVTMNSEGASASKKSGQPITQESKDVLDSFVAEDGGDIKLISCEKNPGHDNFIPVTHFKLDNLPEDYQSDEKLKTIFLWADLTVKIKVKYVSKDRPETYWESKAKFPNYKFRGSLRKVCYGSGYIFSVTPDDDVDDLNSIECCCFLCQQSEELVKVQSWYFTVVTSIHVIYDSDEAKRSIFECFYDSDETRSDNAKYLYGIRMYQQIERDREKMSYVICVTHDKELAKKLQALIKQRHDSVMWNDSSLRGPAILISHPHGCSKTITIGDVLHLTVPTGDDYTVCKPTPFEDETECILPYKSLSEVPMLDFVQAHGDDPQDSNKSDLAIVDELKDQNAEITCISKRTDSLALAKESSQSCSSQACECNHNPLEESQTSASHSNHKFVNQNQSCNTSVVTSLSDDPPSGYSGSNCLQDTAASITDPTISSTLDKNNTTSDTYPPIKEDKPSTLQGTDDINLQDSTDTLSVYYVDESLDDGNTVSIPDPDHLISLTLPPKMTFTISAGAEFARRYNNMKALFHFPPGTKFHLADGKEVYLPEDAQFYSSEASIQTGYMTYMVDSCPASSGGCMLLDGGNSFLHTFPHAGSAAGGVSVCGLRCYPILPSAV